MKKNFKSNLKTKNIQDNTTNIKKTILPNGIKIITEEVPNAQSFALGITVNVGARDDYPEYSGLAHFVEHATFKHTSKRNAKQIAEQFESIGAYVNAYTTKELTCYYVRALNPNFTKALNLLTDLALNPNFPNLAIEKEKKVIIEEIKAIEDDPEELIFDISDNYLFKGTSLSNSIAGTVQSVKKIDSSILKDFHQNFYSTNNIFFTFAGNINHNFLVESIEKIINPSLNQNVTQKRNEFLQYEKVIKILQKSFVQSHIMLCKPVPGLHSKDKYILQIINTLLGDGMSSRLYQALREKNGWAYNVYSTLNQYSDIGALYIYSSVDSQKINETQKLIEKEILKLTKEGIQKKEFSKACEQVKSSLIISLESLSSKMQYLAKSEILYKDYENIYDIIKKINDIELDEVNEKLKEYLNLEDWSVIIFNPY